MAYQPGTEPTGSDNVNVSHSSPLREFAQLLLGAFAILGLVYLALGLLIDRAVDWIDPASEKALFSQFGEAFEATDPGDDTRQLQVLVDDLQACLDPGYSVDVTLTEEPLANAFALPGGRMIVTRGLLDQVQSENGLSFVLAHELGHFANRDHLRGLGRGLVLTAISSVVVGTDSALNSVFSPASLAGQARFSRTRESAADSSALAAVACHYGHVGGSLEFFESMRNASPQTDGWLESVHYFSSHPEVDKRIRDIKSLIDKHPYPTGAVRPLPFDGTMPK